GLGVSLVPSVLGRRTISLSKFTSGTFSATFHALTSFAKSWALVTTPFSGISLASFSSSIEPIQVLVAWSGVGAARATPAARNITAARASHLHNDIARLLEPSCHWQRNKPNEKMLGKQANRLDSPPGFIVAKAKLPGPPARTLKRGKPGWRPRSASAAGSALTIFRSPWNHYLGECLPFSSAT